jgi:hypothetical protein
MPVTCGPIPGWLVITGNTKQELGIGTQGSDQRIALQAPRVFSITVWDRIEPGLRQSGTTRKIPK